MKFRTLLRSRRLAAVLLVAFFSYAAAATLMPASGSFRPYSSPLFVLFAAILTAATAVCAWDRTGAARREWGGHGVVTDSVKGRLQNSPSFLIETTYTDTAAALTAVAAALRGLRLKARSGPVLVEAESGRIGLLGSPLFHWALVMLFVSAAFGQLTRYEGYVNLVTGSPVADTPESYALLLRGPLALGFTGAEIEVIEIDRDFVAEGVARGVTPLVEVSDKSGRRRRQWVYSNSPLRFRSLMIHNREQADSVLGAVRIAGQTQSRPVAVHFAAADAPGSFAGGFHVVDPSLDDTMTVLLATAPDQQVSVLVKGAAESEAVIAGEGDTVELGQGVTFTVENLTTHVQLIVANDPSVPVLYLAFLLVVIGASITAFVRPRTVRVLARHDDDGRVVLNVLVTVRRSDPAFSGRVERGLTAAFREPLADEERS